MLASQKMQALSFFTSLCSLVFKYLNRPYPTKLPKISSALLLNLQFCYLLLIIVIH